MLGPTDVRRLIDLKRRRHEACSEIVQAQASNSIVDDDAILYLTSFTKVTFGGKMYVVDQLGQPGQRVNTPREAVNRVLSAAGSRQTKRTHS